MPRKLHILPLFLPLLAACTPGANRTEEPQAPPLSIDRLDAKLASADSVLTAREQQAFEAWSQILGSEFTREDYAATAAVKAFEPIVASGLAPLDSVEKVLGHALEHVDSVELMAVVSPYNQAVVTHPDGFVFIALNHYLGPDSPVYAGRFAEYERSRKSLRRLPADVVEAIMVRNHPASLTDDSPLLHRMLYQGALLQSVLETMPSGTPEATILGLSKEDYAWCVANESRLWNALIERHFLYSADEGIARRLLMPAPTSSSLLADAPGQAALFLSMKIVQSYLRNNPGVSARDLLMNPDFYNSNQSLVNSKYAPANATR